MKASDISDTLAGYAYRAVSAGADIGGAVKDALLAPPGGARVTDFDGSDLGAVVVDACEGLHLSDEAVGYVKRRAGRLGYVPSAHNFGQLRCCLPGEHASHGAACVPCGDRRIRVYPDDLAGMRRLLEVAHHATLGDDVELYSSCAAEAPNVEPMTVAGYRSRDPNAPPAPDVVLGADAEPEPDEDVPDLGDAAGDAATFAAMRAEMTADAPTGPDPSKATTPIGYLTARNPTADPAALAEWLRVLQARDVVVTLAGAAAPAGMHETKSAPRDAGRIVRTKSGTNIGITTAGLRFWTARADLAGLFDAINPFAPSDDVEALVQKIVATWEGIEAEERKQGKPHPEINTMRDNFGTWWTKWKSGDRDVSAVNSQAQQVNMARRIVLGIRQGDKADKPVIGIDPEKMTKAREGAATVSDEARRLEEEAKKKVSDNKGSIAKVAVAALAAVVVALKVLR